MSVKIDLTGRRYGRLTVLRLEVDIPGKKKKWLCRCDCGSETVISGSNLQSGHSTQCKQCQLKDRWKGNVKHNLTKTKLYYVWTGMINRCENKNHKAYHDYGARGISVCDEWHKSEVFFKWAKENGYKEGLEIDRIDVNGNYEPSNCRWITRLLNANNKRNNKFIEHNGETKTLAEWARYYQIHYKNLSKDLKNGMTFEQAIRKGQKRKMVEEAQPKEPTLFGREE